MAKKGPRGAIKLKSSESPYFYITQKNSRNTTDKIKLRKYDPVVKKTVLFEEVKMK